MKSVAYGVENATSPVAPMSIERREPGHHDVLIDIMYCGICHSDIHQARNEWGGHSLYRKHCAPAIFRAADVPDVRFRPGCFQGFAAR